MTPEVTEALIALTSLLTWTEYFLLVWIGVGFTLALFLATMCIKEWTKE